MSKKNWRARDVVIGKAYWHAQNSGCNLQHYINGMKMYTCNPKNWGIEAGDQKFKVIFDYTESFSESQDT